MPLDAYHATLCSVLEERLLKILVLVVHNEADVHQRTRVLLYCTTEQLVAVDFVVEHLSASLSTACHLLYSTLSLNPTQCFESAVDRYYWRRVEHRTLLYVCTVVEHCRNLTRSLTQAFILYDDEGNTSHSEVLLSTCIDTVVLSNVDRTAEDIRRHIADKSYRHFRLLADFSTINSIISCNM